MTTTSILTFVVLLSIIAWVSAQYGTITDLKPVSLGETPFPLQNIKLQSQFALSWIYTVSPPPTQPTPNADGSKFRLSYHSTASSTPIVLGSTSDLTQFTFMVDLSLSADITASKESFFSILIIDGTDTPASTAINSDVLSTLSCAWELISATDYLPCKSIHPQSSPFIQPACGDGTQNLPIDCILSNGVKEENVRSSGNEADANCQGTNAGPKPDVPKSCDLGTCDNAGTCDSGLCTCPPEFAGNKCDKSSSCPSCIVDNTLTCIARAGTCTCRYGFTGTKCETALVPDWPDHARATTTLMAIAIMIVSTFTLFI